MSGSAELDDNVINATVGALFNKAAFYRDAWEKYKKGGEAIGGQVTALVKNIANLAEKLDFFKNANKVYFEKYLENLQSKDKLSLEEKFDYYTLKEELTEEEQKEYEKLLNLVHEYPDLKEVEQILKKAIYQSSLGLDTTAWKSACCLDSYYMFGLILGADPSISLRDVFNKAVEKGYVRESDAFVKNAYGVLELMGVSASISPYISTGKFSGGKYPSLSSEALNTFFQTFNQGGAIHARIGNDPNGVIGHSVIIHGWEIYNGQIYLKVYDPAGSSKSFNYYDPVENKLCNKDGDKMVHDKKIRYLMKYNYLLKNK